MLGAQIFPDDALLDEVARAAQARGMFVISNGRKMVVSPIVPPGFIKVCVKVKNAPLEATLCAA